ncbi:MAG: MFS transporter [Candidatus Bathyarchaeota archaeon]|nr:MFS transporter [Candidatus Bathyarchaeota archaeon]
MMFRRTLKIIKQFNELEKNLLLLFTAGLVLVVGLQFIQPLFPVFLQSLDASEIQISLILSLSSLTGTALMLSSGFIMRRLGIKKMLLVGVSIWALSTFLISLTKDLRLVTVLYMVHGLADAFVGPARMTMISTSASPTTEATVFGLMSLDWAIAGTIAPPLSGFLAESYGWRVPLLGASVMFLFGTIPIFMLKDEAKTVRVEENVEDVVDNFPKPRLSTTLQYFMFGFLSMAAQSVVGTMLPLFLMNQLSLPASIIGLFFSCANIVGVLIQVPGGMFADRYGKKKLITLLMLPIPLLYWVWGLVDSWWVYLLLFVLSRGLMSMTGPATLAIVSEVFPEGQKGSIFGIRMTGVRFGSTVGPLIGGFMYSNYGPASPFLVAGTMFLIAIPFIFTLK